MTTNLAGLDSSVCVFSDGIGSLLHADKKKMVTNVNTTDVLSLK
jgi:hypothetical protein